MKSIEKDMHHYILALLLAIFIVSDVQIPRALDELVNTLLGKVIVIGGALALLFAHPLLGALGIVAAYRLISQAQPREKFVRSRVKAQRIQVPPRRSSNLSASNQFPLTVEEEVIRKMLPTAPGDLPPPSFKPVLDKLHHAARINH